MDMKVGIRVVAAGVFSRRPSLGVPREVVPRTMLDACGGIAAAPDARAVQNGITTSTVSTVRAFSSACGSSAV